MSTSLRVRDAMVAARERPNDPEARAGAAEAWMELGKPKVARIWALDAVHMAPHEERYKRLLLRIEEALLTTDAIWAPEKGTALVASEKTAPWELAATSTVAPPEKLSLESQMNALLGGDLFKERTQMLQRVIITSLTAPAKKGRLLVYALLAGLAALVVAGTMVSRDLKVNRERDLAKKDLSIYLATGSLEQAGEALDRLRALGGADPALEARTEATIHRYGDRSDARKARAAELCRRAEGDDAVVARALIASDSELRMMQDDLRKIWKRSGDGEAAFLLAVIAGKKKAYEAAIDLEPSHIPHLAYYAMFLGKSDAARDVVDQMRDVDPESPWIEKLEKELAE